MSYSLANTGKDLVINLEGGSKGSITIKNMASLPGGTETLQLFDYGQGQIGQNVNLDQVFENLGGSTGSNPGQSNVILGVSSSSIVDYYTQSNRPNGNTTTTNTGIGASAQLSFDGVDITVNAPAIVPVTSSTGLFNWSNAAAWNNAYVAVQGTADVISFINGVPSDAIRSLSTLANSLTSFGPTAQSSFTIPIAATDEFGLPISFSGGQPHV